MPVRELLVRKVRRVRRLSLENGAITIGRASDNTLLLSAKPVSRHHCVIETLDGVARVRDLASHHGTTVNGERVTERDLADGDVIGVAGFEITFAAPRDADAAPSEREAAEVRPDSGTDDASDGSDTGAAIETGPDDDADLHEPDAARPPTVPPPRGEPAHDVDGRDRLERERDRLAAERASLAAECRSLVTGRASLAAERETLAADRARLVEERAAWEAERHDAAEEEETRRAEFGRRETALAGRGETLQAHEEALRVREETLKGLEAAVRSREGESGRRDSAVHAELERLEASVRRLYDAARLAAELHARLAPLEERFCEADEMLETAETDDPVVMDAIAREREAGASALERAHAQRDAALALLALEVARAARMPGIGDVRLPGEA